MHSQTTVLLSALVASVYASPQYDYGTGSSTTSAVAQEASGIHQVTVGPGLSFSPDSITAAEGDWVEFTFPNGHDVAQSAFDSPCQAMDGGVYSGVPESGAIWRMQVNSTDPIWLYCSVASHCQSGMAMVINPPSGSDRTLEAYVSAAAGTSSTTPANVQGGTFGDISSSDPSATESSSGDASPTESGASSSSTDNAASGIVRNGFLLAGALAAGAAALL